LELHLAAALPLHDDGNVHGHQKYSGYVEPHAIEAHATQLSPAATE
jgi:hypothetical protein